MYISLSLYIYIYIQSDYFLLTDMLYFLAAGPVPLRKRRRVESSFGSGKHGSDLWPR